MCTLKAEWEWGTDLRSWNCKMVVLPCRTPILVSERRGWSPFSCSHWLGFTILSLGDLSAALQLR